MTPEEIETEYWLHHYYENPPKEGGTDEEYDRDAILEAMANDADWEELINVSS